LIRHIPDELLRREGVLLDVEAVDEAGSRGRRVETCQHLDRCGLSRSVGTQETEELSPLNPQGNAIDGGKSAEFLGDVVQFNHRNCSFYAAKGRA
jgi:hypothetical protein